MNNNRDKQEMIEKEIEEKLEKAAEYAVSVLKEKEYLLEAINTPEELKNALADIIQDSENFFDKSLFRETIAKAIDKARETGLIQEILSRKFAREAKE